MKKFLFLGIAATAMLASCSNEEVVEMNPQNAIGFESFVDKSTRAATDPSAKIENNAPVNWTNFSVWGWDTNGIIFNNENVSYSSSKWGYTNIQYWAANQTYTFYAIAPYAATGYSVDKDGKVSISDYTQANNTDLMWATPVTRTTAALSDANTTAVEFTFNHILSKVKITFKNSMSNSNTNIKATNIKILNAQTKGSATYDATATTPSWVWSSSNDNATGTLEFGATPIIAMGATGECATENITIPEASKVFTVSFDLELYSGDATTASATYDHKHATGSFTLEPGKAYNIVAEITGENFSGDDPTYPIEFTVSAVNGWDSNTNAGGVNVNQNVTE